MRIITVLILTSLLLWNTSALSQEKLEVDGAIVIKNSEDPTPQPGTIRWTGLNFEGWNGVTWELLTDFEVASVITDVDGNEYRTVKIGLQEWMAQNLRVTRYNDSTPIGYGEETTDWKKAEPWYCWYQHDSVTYADIYGAMYNYYVVADTNSHNVCPDGWQVPTESQVIDLIIFLGMDAGGKIKQRGTQYWDAPNQGATNESRFTALPVGQRSVSNGGFFSHGNTALFWSSTESTEITARSFACFSTLTNLNTGSTTKGQGYSVRCIKIPEE